MPPVRHATLVLASAITASIAAPAAAAPFQDTLVQPPSLGAPQRGSLAGTLARVAFGPGDLGRGAFALPLPIESPSDRGPLLAGVIPRYSPDTGITEWGAGWQADLSIRRFRNSGELDFATDELTSPWGRLVAGVDGYYPAGLASVVRLTPSGAGWTALTADGTRYQFNAADAVTTARGTYEWMLSRVDSLTGDSTTLQWTRNPSGRPFLAAVRWGGRGDGAQYQLTLDHEPVATPFVSYASGARQLLDQRVSRVTVAVRQGTGYATRWSYALEYQPSPTGPAFYLQRVTRTHASGQSDPPTVYDYDLGVEQRATAALSPIPALDGFLAAVGGLTLEPDHSVITDLDQDGLADLETAFDHTTLRQTATGFVTEPLPAAPGASPLCRPDPSLFNRPRTLARIHPDAVEPQVVFAAQNPSGTSAHVVVCDRRGVPRFEQDLPGVWGLGPNARLVDVDLDKRPDLVRVANGQIEVLRNTSTSPDAVAFASSPTITALSPAIPPVASWIVDFNGDGRPDVVVRHTAGIEVWLGLGGGQFEPTGSSYGFFLPGGPPLANLASYQFSFGDFNGDGLSDLILTAGRTVFLFTNRGDDLVLTSVPGLEAIPWTFGLPVIADLSGSGNDEAVFLDGDHATSIQLTSASTGLLRSANDGKGTRLSFGYDRARPAPGLVRRPAVLASLTVASSGYDPVTYRYDYGAPVVHTVGKHLVGFGTVDKRSPALTEHLALYHDDDLSGVPSLSEDTDDRSPGLVRFTRHQYTDLRFHGVRWLRPSVVETGYRSPDAATRLSTTTTYTTYERDRCPTVITTTTPSGQLVTTNVLAAVAALPDDLHCLSSSQGLYGSHPDPTRDFAYTVLLDRNPLGQVTRATQLAPPFVLVLQDVTYDADHRVATITAPGRGTTTLGYDPAGRLTSVTDPLGVVTHADDLDPVTDGLLALRTARPDAPVTAYFRYDGRERLRATWDDASGASELRPLASYAYADPTTTAPGRIDSQALADAVTGVTRQAATLVAADGEPLVAATWLDDHYALGPTTITTRATLSQRTAFAGTVSAAAFAALTSADLRALGTPLAETIRAGFGHPITATTTQQAGVVGTTTSELVLGAGELVTLVHQPGGATAETAVDAAGKLVRKTDELGVTHRYTYDALGRLVRADTPDGRHILTFDPFGRPARISRDGLGAVTYAYDPTTGLPTRKQRLDPAGAVVDTHDTTYDPVGRPVRISDTTPTATGNADLRYDYDGQLAPAGSPTEPGQLGRLTRVRGDGWQRTQRFDPLGRATQYRYSLTGWRDLTCDKTYRADGSVATDTTTITDPTGATRLTTTKQTTLDPAGRVATLRVNGATLYTLTYDPEGRLARADFATGEALLFDHDPVTHHPRGYRVEAPNVTGGAHWDRDPRGLVAAETFDRGPTTTRRDYTYDGRGALIRAANPSNPADLATYSYTPSGLPSTITDLAGTRTIHPGPLGGGTGSAGPPGGDGPGGPAGGGESLRAGSAESLRARIGASSNLAVGGSTDSTTGHRASAGARFNPAFRPTGDLTPNATAIAPPPEDDPGPLTVGDTTYTFDAIGRVVTKAPWTFTYGASGQLLRASRPGRQLDYTYDDADQRLLKRVDGVPVRADLAGAILTEDHLIELVTIGGVVVGLLDNGQFTALLTDPRGTPFAAPDGSPGLATPYGVRATPLPVSDAIDFARLARDPDLDLIRMGVRDYDPKLGQFLTPDPLYLEDLDKCQSSPLQCSLYGYAAGNPISFVDPTGMDGFAALWGPKEDRQNPRSGAGPGEGNVPAEVRELQAELKPYVQAADTGEKLAEVGKLGGGLALDLTPGIGTVRAFARGDVAGGLLSLVGDVAVAGKLVSVAAKLGRVASTMRTLENTGRLYVFRELSAADRAALEAGEGLISKGSGGTIAQHVSGEATRYISAAETASSLKKYSSGSGMIAIDVQVAIDAGAGYVCHSNVCSAVARDFGRGSLEYRNAVSAREVLFKDFVPFDAITLVRP